MIAIIDYGMGNLHSVQKALMKVGAEVEVVTQPEQILQAEKVVLPGVGAFSDAIDTLCQRNLVEPIKEVIQQGKPFLGICLGLQLLFDVSYEDGQYPGLGIIPGQVVKFDFNNHPQRDSLKIPHMGWNSLNIKQNIPLYQGVSEGAFVYFVHSYYVVPQDKTVIATTTEHGIEFVSSICRDNLMATQFHPEKSQKVGMQLLENFTKL